MQRRNPVNDAELRRLYLDEGLSLDEVAQRVGRSRSTVGWRLAKIGVQARQGRPRDAVNLGVDAQRLRQLYEVEGRGLHVVAKELAVSRAAIARALDELGIPRHKAGRPRRARNGPAE